MIAIEAAIVTAFRADATLQTLMGVYSGHLAWFSGSQLPGDLHENPPEGPPVLPFGRVICIDSEPDDTFTELSVDWLGEIHVVGNEYDLAKVDQIAQRCYDLRHHQALTVTGLNVESVECTGPGSIETDHTLCGRRVGIKVMGTRS